MYGWSPMERTCTMRFMLVVPTRWLPKISAEGESVTAGAVVAAFCGESSEVLPPVSVAVAEMWSTRGVRAKPPVRSRHRR